MSAYSLGFAKQMIRAAEHILPPRGVCKEEGQAAVYLSLVAIEIILKSILEQAGYASSLSISCSVPASCNRPIDRVA